MMKSNKPTWKKVLSNLTTVVCLGVFMYAAFGLFDIFTDYYQNRKMLNNVQDTFYNAASAEENSTQGENESSHTIRPGFKELLKQNLDVVGSITIDGRQNDYPVLKSSNSETYFRQNDNNSESIAGSILLDYRNDISARGQNTVRYRHRMKDGSMFQHLTTFLEDDFFETHRTFEFVTLYNSYVAEILAVYNT